MAMLRASFYLIARSYLDFVSSLSHFELKLASGIAHRRYTRSLSVAFWLFMPGRSFRHVRAKGRALRLEPLRPKYDPVGKGILTYSRISVVGS